MLQLLSIRNYATVERLEIEFDAGMTVITGETGAGKSIILGALGLTLGDRADKTVIRPGANKVDISAEFTLRNSRAAAAWLEENDLEAGEDAEVCLLRRVISSEGRSRAYINGSTVTLANLRTLGEMLLDIHSQHEHQSLLQRATHQRLLDDYAVDAKLLQKLHSTWRQWQQNHQALSDLSTRAEENSAESQLLSYQLGELEEMGIADDEIARLDAEFKTLSHADDTLDAISRALNLLKEDDETNAAALLHQARAAMQQLPEVPQRVQAVLDMLETAAIQLDEASGDLRDYYDEFDADPERLEAVNARLSALHSLARKHRIAPEELPALIRELREKLDRLENSDAELERLQATDKLLREQFRQLAGDVGKQRRRGAGKLADAVNEQLHSLSMPHARLEVSLTPSRGDTPQQSGLETVEFLVSTNPGQAPQPLNKIASGGELSRISLAIQVITARTSQVPSLVFDEVDVGIGGGVARVVGELLRQLGEHTQILCVTHQAQVASLGNQHFLVSKHSDGKSTASRITRLEGDDVVREVARMLGGESFSEESLAHAQQMVAGS
ncbi:MAG: DNA repair protein RecN [Pseudohongiellaceae bacterium]